MFAVSRRLIAVTIGFGLLALFIWLAGPLFAFGPYRPLESATSRLLAIGLVIAVWFGLRVARRLRALRAGDLLLAAVLKQVHPVKEQPSAEVQRLRERFEEAVAALKQGRRQGQALYDLPWYVIIGAPGSGKTTALLNSGLKFPLEQRSGRGGLRGVGGTRNCDWWFTDEAILLDTAGRYTTQDSDAASDSEGWREFLALLAKYRTRRPLNGVMLTISAADLMTQGDAEREAHVEAARRRLNELNRELSVQLPVYVMVTKCDLVAGFTEYFDDLTQEQRTQVWGVTFPYDTTASGEATRTLPAEFDALMTRLNERVFARIAEDGDPRRRTAIFAFPQQMAALRNVLGAFVDQVFAPSRLERPVLLRGVYFTSGTQEGTPIDRLLGSLGRRYGFASHAIVPPTGRGKAYFVTRLLKDVMIGESGLAGMNRTLEIRKAAALLATYTAIALVPVIAFVAWSWSASRNAAYLDDVAGALDALDQVAPVTRDAPLPALVPRLDAVRQVADVAGRYDDDTPWGLRWGLFQGRSIGNAARDAYARELDGALLPRVAGSIRTGLARSAEPEAQYEYLKAYLMLGDPRRLDRAYLQEFADFAWRSANGASAEIGASLSRHFQALLARDAPIRPLEIDATLVAQARNTIRGVSIPRIMYERLRRRYAADAARAVRLDLAAGVGADVVLRRASGTPLSTTVPALYSKPVFQEATTTTVAALVAEYTAESWVWGDTGLPPANPAALAAELIGLYERDYVTHWDDVLADVDLVRVRTVADMAEALGILGGASSPLRALLMTVADHTRLVDPAAAAPAPPTGTLASAGKAVTDRVAKLVTPLANAAGLLAIEPGRVVTAHFQPLHQFVTGEPGAAPVDHLLARMGDVNKRLQQLGPEVGSQPAIAGLTDPALREALGALRQSTANAPPVVRALVASVGEGAVEVVAGDARGELDRRYADNVVEECRAILTGRYPFAATATREVPIADFGRLFGYKGVYERFFATYLTPLVDTSLRPWRWRPGADGSAAMLRQFEAARRIRDLFFPADADRPAVTFTLTFSDMNPRATRFVLDVDGTPIEHLRGPSRRASLSWPGKLAGAVATFEDRSGPRQIESIQGPWAWFRLVDRMTTERTSDTGLILEFQGLGHFVRVAVEADSIRNPFGVGDWRAFSCEP
jgi:type VI secretion system protein ImpL